MLSASQLPGFGESAIVTSGSAANPGGQTSMVSLGSDNSRFVLGIEDNAINSKCCDADSNHVIIGVGHVSLGLVLGVDD